MEFEWDLAKGTANALKHEVYFEEATTVFGDPFEMTIPDRAHSQEELRFVSIGRSSRGRLIVVAYTERGERIRVISARVATPQERRQYESTD